MRRDCWDKDPCPARPDARPKTRADSPWSFRSRKSPDRERRRSTGCRKPGKEHRAELATTDILTHVTFRKSKGNHAIAIARKTLSSQQPAERTAHDSPANRTADRAADGF